MIEIKFLFYKGKEFLYEWDCSVNDATNIALEDLEFSEIITAECSQSYSSIGKPPCLHKGILARRKTDNQTFLVILPEKYYKKKL